MAIKTRVTGILIEDQKLLLVKQKVTDSRNWSLPGGTLEFGETLEKCINKYRSIYLWSLGINVI